MGFDRIRIKENAKTHYDLNKWNNVLVAFISSIIMGAVSGITSGISNFSSDSDDSAGLVITIYIVNIVVSIFVTNIMAMGTATLSLKAAKMSVRSKNSRKSRKWKLPRNIWRRAHCGMQASLHLNLAICWIKHTA